MRLARHDGKMILLKFYYSTLALKELSKVDIIDEKRIWHLECGSAVTLAPVY